MVSTNSQPSLEALPATGDIPPSQVPQNDNQLAGSVGPVPNADALSEVLEAIGQNGLNAPDMSTQSDIEAKEWTDGLLEKPSTHGHEYGRNFLYEGPPKCKYCIKWVEEYPDDLRELAEEKEDTKAKAIVARMKKSHEDEKPLVLDSI